MAESPQTDGSAATGERPWYWHAGWLVAAGVLALGVSGVFSSILHLPRRLFILPHLVLTGGFLFAYLRANGTSVVHVVRRRWKAGLLGAAVLVPFSLFEALQGSQSAHAQGWRLAFDLAWSGVVYGILDAILLSVLPVLICTRIARALGWSAGSGRWRTWALALASTVVVTALFHVGFPEYGGADIVGAVFGNVVLTAGLLASRNVLTPTLAHAVLHFAAVLYAPGTTPLLPPH